MGDRPQPGTDRLRNGGVIMHMTPAFIILIIIASMYRYGECKKNGEKGIFYLFVTGYLLIMLVLQFV